MLHKFWILLCFCTLISNNCLANINSITKISAVEKLCKIKSLEALEEQGIISSHWLSQAFNGDKTFNIDAQWSTNVGVYIIECELPYGSSESALSMTLIKE